MPISGGEQKIENPKVRISTDVYNTNQNESPIDPAISLVFEDVEEGEGGQSDWFEKHTQTRFGSPYRYSIPAALILADGKYYPFARLGEKVFFGNYFLQHQGNKLGALFKMPDLGAKMFHRNAIGKEVFAHMGFLITIRIGFEISNLIADFYNKGKTPTAKDILEIVDKNLGLWDPVAWSGLAVYGGIQTAGQKLGVEAVGRATFSNSKLLMSGLGQRIHDPNLQKLLGGYLPLDPRMTTAEISTKLGAIIFCSYMGWLAIDAWMAMVDGGRLDWYDQTVPNTFLNYTNEFGGTIAGFSIGGHLGFGAGAVAGQAIRGKISDELLKPAQLARMHDLSTKVAPWRLGLQEKQAVTVANVAEKVIVSLTPETGTEVGGLRAFKHYGENALSDTIGLDNVALKTVSDQAFAFIRGVEIERAYLGESYVHAREGSKSALRSADITKWNWEVIRDSLPAESPYHSAASQAAELYKLDSLRTTLAGDKLTDAERLLASRSYPLIEADILISEELIGRSFQNVAEALSIADRARIIDEIARFAEVKLDSLPNLSTDEGFTGALRAILDRTDEGKRGSLLVRLDEKINKIAESLIRSQEALGNSFAYLTRARKHAELALHELYRADAQGPATIDGRIKKMMRYMRMDLRDSPERRKLLSAAKEARDRFAKADKMLGDPSKGLSEIIAVVNEGIEKLKEAEEKWNSIRGGKSGLAHDRMKPMADNLEYTVRIAGESKENVLRRENDQITKFDALIKAMEAVHERIKTAGDSLTPAISANPDGYAFIDNLVRLCRVADLNADLFFPSGQNGASQVRHHMLLDGVAGVSTEAARYLAKYNGEMSDIPIEIYRLMSDLNVLNALPELKDMEELKKKFREEGTELERVRQQLHRVEKLARKAASLAADLHVKSEEAKKRGICDETAFEKKLRARYERAHAKVQKMVGEMKDARGTPYASFANLQSHFIYLSNGVQKLRLQIAKKAATPTGLKVRRAVMNRVSSRIALLENRIVEASAHLDAVSESVAGGDNEYAKLEIAAEKERLSKIAKVLKEGREEMVKSGEVSEGGIGRFSFKFREFVMKDERYTFLFDRAYARSARYLQGGINRAGGVFQAATMIGGNLVLGSFLANMGEGVFRQTNPVRRSAERFFSSPIYKMESTVVE